MLPRDQIGAPPTTEMHCLTTMAYWMMTTGNLALPPAANSDQDHQEPPSPSVVELAPPAFGLLSVVYAAIFDPIATAQKIPRGKSTTHFYQTVLGTWNGQNPMYNGDVLHVCGQEATQRLLPT
eukprot:scaffold63737_cov83-Cyclotella_meneghiniana.AAC.4